MVLAMSIPAIRPEQVEKYSSAVTLSDMEVFIFPELLYSLVLANIMSPRLWAWREDPWFAKLDKMTPYRRVQRLKQYIIDHYEFNLDLDTWGLTTQERELARFRPFVDEKAVAESNALFGYEGDKYYFDLDIRRHFGLDKYTADTIPYWKTETLEAMDAFRFKEGYAGGAGECVSLSTLYAAALFVVCGIPLSDIYLMATPLHSQNFVLVQDGILTNNRRLVTKKMWFNGTELTAKAQRALRHEQVTIVAHHTGYIHIVYPQATIRRSAYDVFKQKLKAFLGARIDSEVLASFFRQHRDLQPCFQVEHLFHGKPRYIPLEEVYHYEHSSPYKASDKTREKLLEEIDEDEFFAEPIPGRILLNKMEAFLTQRPINFDDEQNIAQLVRDFNCQHDRAAEIMQNLRQFVHLVPRLPDESRCEFVASEPIELATGMTREQVVSALESLRSHNPVADLAFYAYRDLARTDWAPFLKAAVERNPVSIAGTKDLSDDAVIALIEGLPNESIYDGARLAQPDEVWNYRRGDGLERALCLANIWKARHPGEAMELASTGGNVTLKLGQRMVTWPTGKRLDAKLTL
ncbi:MAG: hypothetical protein JXB04_01340 [Kiritimatiellae bacterium]|nr:hypothetical protein [Kiritimatiellia bacterium]